MSLSQQNTPNLVTANQLNKKPAYYINTFTQQTTKLSIFYHKQSTLQYYLHSFIKH